MWDRIFLLSLVIFFTGMLAVLAGEFVVPSVQPVTAVVGGSIAGLAGLSGAVSGIVLILTTDFGR